MTLPLWAAVAIPAACLFAMVAIFAWSLCRAAAKPDPDPDPPDLVEPGARPRFPAPGSGDGPSTVGPGFDEEWATVDWGWPR